MVQRVPIARLRRGALRLLTNPGQLAEKIRAYHAKRRFRARILDSTPIEVPSDTSPEVHVLAGCRSVLDAIGSLKSFYRFLSDPLPIVLHDDGTLTDNQLRFLRLHFPGIRIIPRDLANREIVSTLRKAGLHRCVFLRENLIFALKLFDVQYYGRGKSVLYLDTDILFFQRPVELIASLFAPPGRWVDRYNEDVATNYAWSAEEIRTQMGINVLPRVNAGLLCVRREELDWSFYENCLQMPQPNFYYTEQTLHAIDLSSRKGVALPPEYDVAFRHTWRGDYERWLRRADNGHQVVSQHYCGGVLQRAHFFGHFVNYVAPFLEKESTHAVARDATSALGTA